MVLRGMLLTMRSLLAVSCKGNLPWTQQDWIVIEASTSCHPVAMPGEKCPDALSWDEQLQMRGTLDMCVPRAWNEVQNVTDAGFDFETEAKNVDANAMACLRRYLTKKAKILSARH